MILVLAGLLVPVSRAVAEPPAPPKCFRMNANGELPTCTWNGGSWSVDYPSTTLTGGISGWFVALFVLALFAGVGLVIWRVSTARQLAQKSGLDQGQATAMALLEDDGLEATYLAANLRGTRAQPETVAAPRSTENRLRELQQLPDDGLVNEEEYQERRRGDPGLALTGPATTLSAPLAQASFMHVEFQGPVEPRKVAANDSFRESDVSFAATFRLCH